MDNFYRPIHLAESRTRENLRTLREQEGRRQFHRRANAVAIFMALVILLSAVWPYAVRAYNGITKPQVMPEPQPRKMVQTIGYNAADDYEARERVAGMTFRVRVRYGVER